MKALVTADWHLSNTLPHAQRASDTLISDRLRDIQKALDWILNAAADRDLPLLVLGDIFDRRQPDAVTLKAAATLFKSIPKLGVDVFMLPGNHDAHDTRGLHYVIEAFGGERSLSGGGVRVMEAGVIEQLDGGALCPVPSMSRTATLELIREYRAEKVDGAKILLLHDTIVGSRLAGGREADDGIPKDELEGFSYVLAGHLHEFQKLSPIKGVYIGSPYQVNGFNEAANEPSIGMISTEGRRVAFHRIRVPPEHSRWFHEVRYNQDGDVREIGERGAPYFRLVYEGSDEALDAQKAELDAIYTEGKRDARSHTFVHRDAPGAGRGRLGIDVMAEGLPPVETLVGEYVKLHREGDAEAYIQAGLALLGGHDE